MNEHSQHAGNESSPPRMERYEDVFLTDSPHLASLARKFFERAATLRRISVCILGFTALLILVGIVAFLWPTTFTDISDYQSQLGDTLTTIRRDIEDLSTKHQQITFADDLFNLYGLFYEVKRNLEAAGDLSKSTVGQRRLTNALTAAQEVASQSPERREFKVDGYAYHERTTGHAVIPARVFLEGRRQMTARGIAVSELASEMRNLREALSSKEEFDRGAMTDSLSQIDDLWRAARDEHQKASKDLDEIQRNRVEFERQIQDARDAITNTLLEAIETGATYRDGTWIPQLTVRVGVVVLLLFLSSILFSTYRYTLTLAAYYDARGDALQMLSRRKDGELLDVKELATILPLLSPDAYRIEKVKPPYEALRLPRG